MKFIYLVFLAFALSSCFGGGSQTDKKEGASSTSNSGTDTEDEETSGQSAPPPSTPEDSNNEPEQAEVLSSGENDTEAKIDTLDKPQELLFTDGDMKGSSIIFPANTFPVGVKLRLKKGQQFNPQTTKSDLGLSDDLTMKHFPLYFTSSEFLLPSSELIVTIAQNPTEDVTEGSRLIVVYKIETSEGQKIGVIESNKITTIENKITFSFTLPFQYKSGAFQKAEISEAADEIAEEQQDSTEEITDIDTPATPVFSPNAGSYSEGQLVTITTVTDGAGILYSTDGSTPSVSYSAPLALPLGTTTVKAIASKDGVVSGEASAVYTLTDSTNPPAPVSVDDDVRYDSQTETPSISWVSPADTTDIHHYELALGTTSGGTDVLDWTDVGLATTYQHTGAIPNGKVIYASVKSVDASSNESSPVNGDGYENLECPNDTTTNGVGVYIKVFGNTTAGLGGKHYTEGTKTLLDWTGANAGNSWTPTQSARTLSDFCVAKYEMKLWHEDEAGSGFSDQIVPDPQAVIPGNYDYEGIYATQAERDKFRAVSAPQGGPWVEIKTGLDGTIGAYQACANLGTNYMLINNSQWQAIARDIEATSDNWDTSDGDANNHHINRGHSDNSPGNALLNADIAGPDFDDDPCIGTGQTNCATASNVDFTQKRTHTLSSDSSALWDFAGNIREWVLELNHRTDGHGVSGADADGFTSTEPFVGDNATEKAEYKLQWGPNSDHTGKNSGEYGGLGQFNDDSSPGGDNDASNPGAVVRGGHYNNNSNSGPFYVSLHSAPSDQNGNRGFRCTYAP